MSNKIAQLHDAEGNGMLPITVTDAVAAGNQTLTEVLKQLLNRITDLETSVNNLSDLSGVKLDQLAADVAALKEANLYQII